ncbi:MAG: alkane 1-monooxygenase, partial [Eudoraea sp.]
MKDLKYLAAFTIPISAFIGIYFKGYWSFITPIYAFLLIPAMELLLPINATNLEGKEREASLKNKLFDWLLYLNIPLVFGLLYYSLNELASSSYENHELLGIIISMGIVLGTNGIN